MNGRWFDERQLVAYIKNGAERFKKSAGKSNVLGGDEDDEDGVLEGVSFVVKPGQRVALVGA